MTTHVRLLAFTVVLALVAACAPGSGPSATSAPTGPSGTLTIAMRGEIESTHPYLTSDIVGISARMNMFDNLVDYDWEGKLVPGLAESWQVTNLTIQFKLRKGVKFHNGEDFDADSVKASFDHLKSADLKSPAASNVAAVQEIKILDQYTVEMILSRIDARIFDVLANNVSILPAKYLKEAGIQGFIAKPIGTGPFKFVSWTKDDKLVMEANESYWTGGYKGKANVKQLIFRPIPTAATRVAELKAGAVDVVHDLPPDQVDPVKADANLQVISGKSPVYTWAFFNTTSAAGSVLKDQKVRLAMNHAVDTATIIKTVLQGHARQLSAGITDQTMGYDPSVKPIAFDQAKAKALLAEAGVTTLDLEADISSSQKSDVAEAVIAQLGQVGIKVKLNPLPTAVFNDRWVKKQLSPLYFVTWNTFTHPALLDLLAGCKGFISSFCSQSVQPFLDEGGRTLDQAQQEAAYKKAVAALAADPFAIYLHNQTALLGASKKVSGWKTHAVTYIVGTNVRVN